MSKFFGMTPRDDVFDILGCPSDIQTLTPEGFQLESHQVVLYGVCPPCSAIPA